MIDLFSTKIESFRMEQGMTVKELCSLSQISQSQYSKYINRKKEHLSISDAVRLLATFPGKLTVSKLLRMTGGKQLKLSREFPRIVFSEKTQTENKETETVFRRFIIRTAFNLFAPDDAISILASFLQPCSDDSIYLPMEDSMNFLMSNLKRIRKIRYSDCTSPRNTVVSHFQRTVHPVRFSDICGYERLFRSGGIYLLSELMYLNEREKIGIKLCQKDNM